MLDVIPDNIPQALRELDQWVVWRAELTDNGSPTKPPYDPKSPFERAYSTVPETWSSFSVAMRTYEISLGRQSPFNGLGFALTEESGIVGIDLDHVSLWRDDAQRIVDTLASYTEISPGGDGFRIFARATLPAGRRKRDYVEMYADRHFLSVTGACISRWGEPQERQLAVELIHWSYLGEHDRPSAKRE